jgi:hypothetical protein
LKSRKTNFKALKFGEKNTFQGLENIEIWKNSFKALKTLKFGKLISRLENLEICENPFQSIENPVRIAFFLLVLEKSSNEN